MSLENCINILKELNNGNIIYNHDDQYTEVVVSNYKFKLYHDCDKYYFLAQYTDNYDELEEDLHTLDILESDKIRPHNSYLVLFYEIKEFTDEISKKVIKLEENEFFYKKYVFYYTKEEYNAFSDWFQSQNNKSLTDILKSEISLSNAVTPLHIDFLLRLAIKVPFLHLEFSRAELHAFETIVQKKLHGIKDIEARESTKRLYDHLSVEMLEKSPEAMADALYKEIMREEKNEN